MPSFYPLSRQLPLTPPEYTPSYASNGCAGMPYQQNSYAHQALTGRHDEPAYDFADHYSQSMVPSTSVPTMYQQPPPAYTASTVNIPAVNRYYEQTSAPILPPMRTYESSVMNASSNQHTQHQQRQDSTTRVDTQQSQTKEEKHVGGVSAKLDYDMEIMTDFVSEMAQGIVQPGQAVESSFRKWVHQVLCATRLPSATLVLSLQYLSIGMQVVEDAQHQGIHKLLTAALILGSKFLDDNTFINRSWSEVSGIAVADLNRLELYWLFNIKWTLHRSPFEEQGFSTWEAHWKNYEGKETERAAARSLKPSPINTNVQHQRSVLKPFTPATSQQAYGQTNKLDFTAQHSAPQYSNPSPYSQYESWSGSRSATDSSPMSAPHTGPTTPEYYGAPGVWGPPEGYSRRTMFGFKPLPQPQPQPQASAPLSATYNHAPYTPQYQQYGWGAHNIGCPCIYCTRQHPSSYHHMAPGMGPQLVMG